MNHDAIFNTHPNVVQIVDDTAYENVDGKLVQVTLDTDAVAAEEARMLAAYNATEYQRKRVEEYPSIGDQLDMLYKDQVNGTTTFRDHVAAVKAANPAPADEPDNTEIQATGTEENPAWEA